MSKTFGIDISYWQKGMNLATAKKEGVEFAIIRGAYSGSFNRALAKDSNFETHYENAKENGLGVGVYFFSRACSYEEGKKEAEYLYTNCLKGKVFEYPIYIDVEDCTYQVRAGKEAVTSAIKGFCETLEAKGYYVGVYANIDWINNYMNYGELKDKYDFWIAAWNSTQPNTSKYKYGMWQFGGETNKIRKNIVAGYVCDQNYSFKNYPSIMKENGLNGYSKETGQPDKKPEQKPSSSLKYSKGDKVILNGYLYKDSYGNGQGNRKTNYKGTITNTNKDGSKPYHIDSLGWVAEADLKPVTKLKVGDKVIISGYLYPSSNAEKPTGSVKNKVTYITRYEAKAKHPYNTTGDSGWMNENSIKRY